MQPQHTLDSLRNKLLFGGTGFRYLFFAYAFYRTVKKISLLKCLVSTFANKCLINCFKISLFPQTKHVLKHDKAMYNFLKCLKIRLTGLTVPFVPYISIKP